MAQKKEITITDFGEKIGGARKDVVKANRIDKTLLTKMNERELLSFVTKTKVLPKFDYVAMIDSGIPVGVVYFVKTAYDRFPKIPKYSSTVATEDSCVAYIEALEHFEEEVGKIKTKQDALALFENYLIKYMYVNKSSERMYTWTEKAYLAGINHNPLFKTIALTPYAYVKLEVDAKLKNFGSKVESSEVAGKRRKVSLKIVPPQLSHVVREGYEHRQGRNISGEDYLKTFGFKGGEFGNWTNQKDRQISLNYGYDALLDLACLLKCDPQSLSLNNSLSIAFGSRGVANSRAHYEPLRKVINLTKINGAGSLAHEFFHALDDHLGELFGFKNKLLSATNFTNFSNKTEGPYGRVGDSFKNLIKVIKYTGAGTAYLRNSEFIDSLTSSTGRVYWSKPEELLARAFSCYVQDRLGIRSDYLEGATQTSCTVCLILVLNPTLKGKKDRRL